MSEVRRGRLPLWNPYNYCGAPFLAANNTAVFSPFQIPHYLFPSPVTIAWVQLLKALVAGGGAYCFFRCTLRVGFWPAAVGAWCFPLGWFFILWRGYPPSFVVAWLPWLLLATDYAVRKPSGWGGPAVAAVTAVVMVSGQAATAAHVLLASGLYALWCLFDQYVPRRMFTLAAAGAIAAVVGGWLIGFLLSAPQNLPTAEYLQYSNRIAMRQAGTELSSAPGIMTWPQLVLPYFYGSFAKDSVYIPPGGEWKDGRYRVKGNPLEGTPSGYGGCLIALWLAPLGWYSRRRRKLLVFWLLMGLFAVGFLLYIPGLREVFHFFPLSMLKNNRFVFLATWSLLVMAVVGVHVISTVRLRWHLWTLFPAGLLLFLVIWSLWRGVSPPPELQQEFSPTWGDPDVIRDGFRWTYMAGAAICGTALLLWVAVWLRLLHGRIALAMAAIVCVGELLLLGFGVNPQVSRDLYYPKLKPLDALTHAPRGRICGVLCLSPCLNQRYNLYDIRGYDGVDPAPLVELLELCERKVPPGRLIKPRHAVTQYFYPVDSPLLDMLNLRYRVLRGDPPPGVAVFSAGDGLWVAENRKCLSPAFVPRRVESVANSEEVLAKLGSVNFDPRRVAYVAEPLSIANDEIRGSARLIQQADGDPKLVKLRISMQTPGLVVLSDLWFPGWNAYLNGRPVKIVRTNHALRGVVVPKGKGRLELRYEPRSFVQGLQLFAAGILVMAAWAALVAYRKMPPGWLTST